MTTVVGIPIPSSSPWFLAGVAAHVLLGLTCVVCGAVAMLSPKRAGRHPRLGTVYFWSLAGVFVTAGALAFARWTQDRVLFLLAALSFAAAILGRQARRSCWRDWPRWHMSGMGVSYIVLLTAFYVDNGKNLPLWRNLPTLAYWLTPGLVGLPILGWAFLFHPLVRQADAR
ncbi:MAG TPA: hypothetical protein VGS12_03815 [Caulobacteraceae bacterium]|nr:hypothetical protein [Caulobacteraceae bacterium]